ncbi:2,5-dichloro-2,5-cyclohexadiene-1,4-diol dehydrogenase [Acaryochloris thomasi RCC1774]|uniref:2,5-dichloro-2,5-cyclohexadiene-1,4-diol dehydrogenase n=1 Tax=Acaryochloris thomasi RCC1774 TaxID=1764569 RepID=A0A2W1JET7_9CYAN|nr:glucose 1-dehydrogenase [Acaryochloris thomasi]PZD72178.1 2,5-dichloro-2,5-cyclohexadiene-1,4-diol dehydrogenase [Acaryochloris thomasi RCC1774]
MTEFTRRQIVTTGVVAATGLTAAIATGELTAASPKSTESSASTLGNRFTNKVILITGATSGIGKVTAKAFAQEGGKVFFCGRRANLGQQVESEIRDSGGEATYLQADVRNAEQVKAFVEGCVAKYGRLDVAFNNAGIDYPPDAIADTDIAAFDDLMNTNARGVFLGMKYEIPHLLKTKGAIINNASIGGHRAFPNIVGYGASKAAVIHMTKMAAQEYGKDIRVNVIAPGGVDTPMWERVQKDWGVTEEQLVSSYPMKRVAQPEEIAKAVIWLASGAASYVSGMRFDIDGGGLG